MLIVLVRYEISRRIGASQSTTFRVVERANRLWLANVRGKHLAGSYETVQEAVGARQELHLIRRTERASVACRSLSDDAVAFMLQGKLGARCTINGTPWKWRSNGDVVGFLPENLRAHPAIEHDAAQLSWTVASNPGTDYDDEGLISLDRLGRMYFWSGGMAARGDQYLGRFDTLFEAKVELWELFDSRGYRLSWDGYPGRHPADGTFGFVLDPALRAAHNDDSWRWRIEREEPCRPTHDDRLSGSG